MTTTSYFSGIFFIVRAPGNHSAGAVIFLAVRGAEPKDLTVFLAVVRQEAAELRTGLAALRIRLADQVREQMPVPLTDQGGALLPSQFPRQHPAPVSRLPQRNLVGLLSDRLRRDPNRLYPENASGGRRQQSHPFGHPGELAPALFQPPEPLLLRAETVHAVFGRMAMLLPFAVEDQFQFLLLRGITVVLTGQFGDANNMRAYRALFSLFEIRIQQFELPGGSQGKKEGQVLIRSSFWPFWIALNCRRTSARNARSAALVPAALLRANNLSRGTSSPDFGHVMSVFPLRLRFSTVPRGWPYGHPGRQAQGIKISGGAPG
jgi:hypothetical protein